MCLCLGWKCPKLHLLLLRYWVCRKYHRLNGKKITGQKNEVIVFSNSERVYFGRADYCSWVSSKLCQFGLNISEGSRNWQPAWESSMRSQYKLMFFTFVEYLNIGVCVAEFGSKCQSMYWYILPPFSMILFCSNSSLALWSSDSSWITLPRWQLIIARLSPTLEM